MARSRIILNNLTSSYVEVVPGSIVSIRNDDDGTESSILWICATGSQPSGSHDNFTNPISSTTALTASKEGTYLLYNLVNGSLTSSAVIAVKHLKSNTRSPAAGERFEESGTFGWARAVQKLFYEFDKLNADSGKVVGLAKTALLRGDLVRVTGTLNIKPGLPGEERVVEFGKVQNEGLSNYDDSLYIVEGEVASGSNSNPFSGSLFTARLYGLFGPLTGTSPAIGNVVKARLDGVPTIGSDFVDRRIGTVVSTNGSTYYMHFNGAAQGYPRIGSSSQAFITSIECGDNETYSGSIPFVVKQIVVNPPRHTLANCTTSIEFYSIVTNSTVNSFSSSVKLRNLSDSEDIATLDFSGSSSVQVKSASLVIGSGAGQVDNSEKIYEISISSSNALGSMEFGSSGIRVINTIN